MITDREKVRLWFHAIQEEVNQPGCTFKVFITTIHNMALDGIKEIAKEEIKNKVKNLLHSHIETTHAIFTTPTGSKAGKKALKAFEKDFKRYE